MGCGSSINQVHDVNIPQKKPQNSQQPLSSNELMLNPDQKFQQLIKPQLFANGKCFLFGQSSTERKIVLFDGDKNQFSILSSKTRIPSPPIKYQPMEIIYEESQQLFSSGLFSQNSHPPYNFMFATFVDEDHIFLCGGVNYDFQNISNQAFMFNTGVGSLDKKGNAVYKKSLGQNLMGTKFQKLAFMSRKRYSHMGSFYQIGKLRYIYVFGGRGQKDQILTNCQKYSIQEKKWSQVSPMHIPRSTGFSLNYRGKIYVFGGYSAQKKRSKKIQVYEPSKDYWETINLKLHRGIEAGIICSPKPNQILLIGGNMELGSLKSTIRVNLLQETYMWDSDMKSQRLLQKGVKIQDNFFVFGGDFCDTMQKYSFKQKKWRPHQLSYSQYISAQDINSFTYSSESIFVDYDESGGKRQSGFDGNKLIVLGCDDYPCIMQISLQKWILKTKAVPMSLRLRSYMGVIQIKQGKYLVCGGIDGNCQKASRSAYIYYSHQNKAIQIQKMKQRRFDFKILRIQNYVYIIGGRASENDYLKSVQRYNLQTELWEAMPDLLHQRTHPTAFSIGNQIVVLGGTDSLQTVYDIQIIHHYQKTVKQFPILIPFSSDLIDCYITKINKQQKYAELLLLCRNDILKKDHFCQMKLYLQNKRQTKQVSRKQKVTQIKAIPNQDTKMNISQIQNKSLGQKQDFQFQLSSQVLIKKEQERQDQIKNHDDANLAIYDEQKISIEQLANYNYDDIENIPLVQTTQIKVSQGKKVEQPNGEQDQPTVQENQFQLLQKQKKQISLNPQQPKEIEQTQNFGQQITCIEIEASIPNFSHCFQFENKYYFLSNKGMMQWSGKPSQKVESKVVINSVHMLEFPLQRFSFG